MKYLDVVKAVALEACVSQADAKRVIEASVKVIRENVANGEEVSINGLGKFVGKKRPARKGVNPFSGKPMEIAERTSVTFKVAKEFKDAVNE